MLKIQLQQIFLLNMINKNFDFKILMENKYFVTSNLIDVLQIIIKQNNDKSINNINKQISISYINFERKKYFIKNCLCDKLEVLFKLYNNKKNKGD